MVCISDNAIKVKQQNGKYLVTDNIDFYKAALDCGSKLFLLILLNN